MKWLAAVVTASVLAVAVVSGIAAAQTSSNDTITGCLIPPWNGIWLIGEGSEREALGCPEGQAAITWNTAGSAGPPGEQGEPGVAELEVVTSSGSFTWTVNIPTIAAKNTTGTSAGTGDGVIVDDGLVVLGPACPAGKTLILHDFTNTANVAGGFVVKDWTIDRDAQRVSYLVEPSYSELNAAMTWTSTATCVEVSQ